MSRIIKLSLYAILIVFHFCFVKRTDLSSQTRSGTHPGQERIKQVHTIPPLPSTVNKIPAITLR